MGGGLLPLSPVCSTLSSVHLREEQTKYSLSVLPVEVGELNGYLLGLLLRELVLLHVVHETLLLEVLGLALRYLGFPLVFELPPLLFLDLLEGL